MALKKWQRNEVFQAVQQAGLSPEEFDFDLGEDESTLRHRPSGAYFVFGGFAGKYSSHYFAGEGPPEARTDLSQYGLMQQLNLWLSQVKQDISTPDLWAQLQGQAKLLATISDEAIDNTSFTPEEREEIAGQLRELRDYVTRTHSLSAAQARLLDEKLVYLVDASRRVGRKDWLLMAAGVMLSFVLGAALPPDAVSDVLATLLTSIGHVLGHGPLGLPGP